MLDLTKLAQQMQGVSQQLTLEVAAAQQRLELAQELFNQAQMHQAELVEQRSLWGNHLKFTAAEPVEPLDTRVTLTTSPTSHTVLATDGSQIAPSHHEVAYCYLINIGRVVLPYGQSQPPLLDSLPEVIYQPEDLYVSRRWGIRTEEWMGHRRTQLEASILAELACDWLQVSASEAPTLAMLDGSLIYWFLESLPAEARDHILPPILQAWDQLRAVGIPLVGYLSASRSSEALSFLRLQACPHNEPDCPTHCPGDHPPCQVLDPLRDTALWSRLLEPGQRGPLWRSSARILDLYGSQVIYFCYVNVGSEVVRVEFPAWVAEDTGLLEQSLSLTLAQVHKGYGYPVTLAEAHHQAVVRRGDRACFFALLEQHLIRAGLKNVGTSYKETRKRGGIA